MRGPSGPSKGAMTDAITHAMTDAMTQHYEALIEARMRLASMMTRQAVATTELTTDLMATLVGASLGTATAVWTSALGLRTRSARSAVATVAGGTAELDDTDDTDDPSRADEAVLVAAIAELMRVDQAPTEQELVDELLDEQQLYATNDAGEEAIDVLFRLPAAVNAEEAYLCGDFNDWSTTADAMNRLPDGSFELVRRLPLGRRWRFRYLLDSDRWENDWAADGYAPNALGDEDSVVDLNAPSASHLVMPDS